jgi:hypothetical protein
MDDDEEDRGATVVVEDEELTFKFVVDGPSPLCV